MTVTTRSSINQVFQIGAEVSPGVGGTAGNRLGTFNSQIAPVASGAFGVFRPSGGKYAGQIVPGDIYAEGSYTDTIDYNTVPFLLAGNVGIIVPTGVGPSWTYRHTPAAFGPGSQLTYVVQEGEAGAVYNYSNVVMPDFGLRFMRTGTSQCTGRVLGRKIPPGTAIASPTIRSGRSISGLNTGVWEADTFAHLASAASRVSPIGIDVAVRNNGVFAPWFGLDDSIISFGGLVETARDAGVQISVLADVNVNDIAGLFNYTSMEDGDTLFLKVLNIGPVITGLIHYSFEIDMSLQISGPPRRADSNGLRVWQWDALFIPDPVSGLPFDITVVNTLDPAAFATS